MKNAGCLGFQENAMLGLNISLLVPSPWKEKHDSYLAAYVPGTSTSRVVGKVFDAKWKRAALNYSSFFF